MFLSTATLLLPADIVGDMQAEHRLLWSLAGAGPDAERDFIFKRSHASSDGQPRYDIISPRPLASTALFSVETKPMQTEYAAGDRLEFELSASATVSRKEGGARRGVRRDLVTDAKRMGNPIDGVAMLWLMGQGERHGFTVEHDEVKVSKPVRKTIARSGRTDAPVTVISFCGRLTVTDPAAFAKVLATGLGRGRAFGCGMLCVSPA